MRRTFLTAVLAALLLLVMAPAAFGHVHGITPLLDLNCKVDNSITGANRTNSTPAAAGNGGPIAGLIPATVGNAPLSGGDGGRFAVGDTVCP
ncbi:MAG: hypothetical protein Q8Q52_08495 [Acidimicrobiia bacterium]|nr:hypothetical protein [Acidimicrobiia bacterium]